MKKAVFFLLLTIFSVSIFAQRITPDTRYDKLMSKSKKKQTAGFIFLGTGAALTAGGIFLIADGANKNNNDYNNSYGLSEGEAEQVLGVLLTGVGIGGMCGSIPFFVGANRSKKKAMAIAVKTENTSMLYKASFSRQFYPVLALQIPLGR
ncbi:MAG: hypothetical protein ABIQ88_09745 [Chitinophagaceae bacterium]